MSKILLTCVLISSGVGVRVTLGVADGVSEGVIDGVIEGGSPAQKKSKKHSFQKANPVVISSPL